MILPILAIAVLAALFAVAACVVGARADRRTPDEEPWRDTRTDELAAEAREWVERQVRRP